MNSINLVAERSKSLDYEKTSLLRETVERLLAHAGARIGLVVLTIMIIGSVFAPLIAKYEYNEMDFSNMFSPPSKEHLLGTDPLGRDLLTRLLYGGRYSLAIGLITSIFGGFISVIFGSIAGYFGGKTEVLIMRMIDIWSSLPAMLMAILISSVLGSGFFNTMLALAYGEVPPGTRLIRGQILKERTKEYLEAAEAINCSKFSIMFRHLLPNVISPLLVHMTMGIGFAITMTAALSFIGLGIQPPTPEWGAILSDGRAHILTSPYLVMFPGLFISLTVFSVNLIGDGLRDALDPKLRR